LTTGDGHSVVDKNSKGAQELFRLWNTIKDSLKTPRAGFETLSRDLGRQIYRVQCVISAVLILFKDQEPHTDYRSSELSQRTH